MIEIEVVSKRRRKIQLEGAEFVLIDRTSVLGNPFHLDKEENREVVIKAYRRWLWRVVRFQRTEADDIAKRFKVKLVSKWQPPSFTVDGSLAVDHCRVKVPVIGWIKTYERLPVEQKPKSFTISRTADRWFISWKIEVEPTCEPKAVSVVGVDLGIKALATFSTGEVLEGAKSYRKYEKKLSQLQWLNRHKVKGSNNWKKSQIQIARLHRKIANIRKDTLHKLTSYLAKNHDKIGIEDLNVSGMLANHKLAKAIADMGFYEFRRQLEYKCELYGSQLVVVDRWFASSKTCSNCGTKKETLSLSERVFKCDCCGLEIDRDLNASINLEKAVS
ncbi:MAG: RNA-guided endonuclease TnpB family protein [Desertifilum sp.]|nr:RNA-guided endonuclease TnpB family protein [Desertifilum sp.]